MPYGFRLKNGKLWKGDLEVAAAFNLRKEARIARSELTDYWVDKRELFKGSKIVRLKPLEEA